VLPDQKAEAVERLKAQAGRVAMAGDGVNDAPHWRMPMSASPWERRRFGDGDRGGHSGSRRIFAESCWARRLSAATMRNIRQNMFFAFIYISVAFDRCGIL